MLTYRKKGVVRLRVGAMDRTQLPLTTDSVFGRGGYDITFTPESPDFIPALPVPANPDDERQDKEDREDGDPYEKGPDHSNKKQKNGSGNPTQVADRQESVPMQVDNGAHYKKPCDLRRFSGDTRAFRRYLCLVYNVLNEAG